MNKSSKILIIMILTFFALCIFISCNNRGEDSHLGKYGLDIDAYTSEKAIEEGIDYQNLGKGEKNKLRNKWEEYLKSEHNPYMIFKIEENGQLIANIDNSEMQGSYELLEKGQMTIDINDNKISAILVNGNLTLYYDDIKLSYKKVNRIYGDPHTKGIKYDFKFKLFSLQHFMALLSTAIAVIISILIFKNVGNNGRTAFRISLASLLIIQDILFMVLKITQGTFDIGFHLPFQISRFAIYMCFFMLLTKNYKLFEITYFFVIGSIHAIITPNLSYSFPHLEYFFFFVSHGGCFVAIYYMIFVEKYEPTVKSFWKSVVLALSLMVVMIPINFITNGNYLYIMNQPSEDTGATTTLDIFGPWPIYIIFIIIIGFVTLFLLGLLPFLIKKLLTKKNKY